MTDAHCHLVRGATRHFVCEPCGDIPEGADVVRFVGTHPWRFADFNPDVLRARLEADPRLGVGEIGLDRMREREIPQGMADAFEEQLRIAAEFGRPVVLHGAKCWGRVVDAIRRVVGAHPGSIPAFLFHGFSRSGGLLPEIFAMNGWISVGPAVLNDHAVNYRELVRSVPAGRLLAETDCTEENAGTAPGIDEVVARLAVVRGVPLREMEDVLESNARSFASPLR